MRLTAKQYLIGAAVLVVAGYLAWSFWGKRPQTTDAGFVPAAPAVSGEKEPGPTVPLKVVPKKEVKKKHPNAHVDAPDVVVVDTAKVPPAPDGAVTITTINTTTGVASTEVQINKAPNFALERLNYLGVGYEWGSDGVQKAKLYIKRDLIRIKNAHLQGEAQLRVPIGSTDKIEGVIGANAELRWQ